MSLILDALRKSEAERRRGQSPDLFASPPLAETPRPQPWPRALPVLLLVALALAAVFVLWPHGEDAVNVRGENVSDPEKATHLDADSRSAGPDLAATSARPALASASAPTSTGHAPATPGAGRAAPVTGQPGSPRIAAHASESESESASAFASAAIPSLPPTPIPASTPTLAPAPASTPTPDADDNPGETLPPIAVLAASERAALPPLKLSMHVWNSEPRKRFAIIDGQRTTEGSTVGAGVIEEIRRDGVVLNINGRRVLLPRP